MTDPTPQTPTRDEAVLTGIQISGRTLYKLDERGVNIWSANFQPNSGYSEIEADKAAQAVAKIVFRALASAPAPASGGVNAVERLEDKIEGLEADLASAVEVAFRRGAAEWTRLNYPALYVRLNAASLSPAATPVSEAGGEVDWLVEHLLSWPCTGDERDGKSEAYINGLMRQAARRIEALAKPASSPAGGDVVEAVERIEAVIRMCENAQSNLCYGNVSAQAVASSAILGLGEIARVAQQALAALAQIAAPGTAMERDYADEAAPAGRITSALERAP